MTTTDLETRTHPVTRFASRVHTVLDDLRETPAWSMTPDEQRAPWSTWPCGGPDRGAPAQGPRRRRHRRRRSGVRRNLDGCLAGAGDPAHPQRGKRRRAAGPVARGCSHLHARRPGRRAARRGPGPRRGPGGRRPAGVRRPRRPGPGREAPPAPRGAARRRCPQAPGPAPSRRPRPGGRRRGRGAAARRRGAHGRAVDVPPAQRQRRRHPHRPLQARRPARRHAPQGAARVLLDAARSVPRTGGVLAAPSCWAGRSAASSSACPRTGCPAREVCPRPWS